MFTSTRHHVEFLFTVLQAAGVSAACVYGAMDQVRPSPLLPPGAQLPKLDVWWCLLVSARQPGHEGSERRGIVAHSGKVDFDATVADQARGLP